MINLVKENEKSLQPEKYDYCYKLVEDNRALGYGTINKDKENALFIFINKEERGNGYGKILFSKMLNETKNMGFNEVKITFGKENTPMLKIAEDNGGRKISSDEDTVKYVIPIV